MRTAQEIARSQSRANNREAVRWIQMEREQLRTAKDLLVESGEQVRAVVSMINRRLEKLDQRETELRQQEIQFEQDPELL